MKRYFSFILIICVIVCCVAGCSKEKETALEVKDELIETVTEVQTENFSISEPEESVSSKVDEVEEESVELSSIEASTEEQVGQIEIDEITGVEIVTGYPEKMAFIDNIGFNLPVSFYFLKDLGFYFDETDEDYIEYKDMLVGPGEKISATFNLLNDNYDDDVEVFVHLCNDSESLMSLEDLDVYRISIDVSTNASADILKLIPEFEVEPGVFWNMSKSELIANLGEPIDVYSCDNYEKLTFDNYYTELIVQVGKDSGVNKIVVDNRK